MAVDPERREWRKEVVRLADLTVNTEELKGLTFEDCRIIGPAVLLPLGSTSITYCRFPGDFEAIAWVYADDRQRAVGPIIVRDCTFFRCSFTSVGLAMPVSQSEKLRRGFAEED